MVEFGEALVYGHLGGLDVRDVVEEGCMDEFGSPLIVGNSPEAVVDVGLGLFDLLHDLAGIAKLVVLHSHHVAEHVESFHAHLVVGQREVVLAGLGSTLVDFEELVGSIVVDMDGVRETTAQSRVGVHERFHLLGITRTDDHKLASLVLHARQQQLDGITSLGRCALASLVHGFDAVGLIEKQHATHSLVDGIVHVLGRLIDVLAENLVGHLLDDTVGAGDTQSLENLAKGACYGGLAGTGFTSKDEVELGESLGCLALLDKLLLDSAILGVASYGTLDTLHANKLIEFLHDVVDRNFFSSFLADEIGIREDVILRIALAMALQTSVKEVAHLAGIAESVATLEVHLVEHLG